MIPPPRDAGSWPARPPAVYPHNDATDDCRELSVAENATFDYRRDVPARWSPEDLAAQQEFVNWQIADSRWLDWSTPAVALQLVQAAQAQTPVGTVGCTELD